MNTGFKMNEDLAALIRMEEAETDGSIQRKDKNGLWSLNISTMKLK
jgi:hypothetical protein